MLQTPPRRQPKQFDVKESPFRKAQAARLAREAEHVAKSQPELEYHADAPTTPTRPILPSSPPLTPPAATPDGALGHQQLTRARAAVRRRAPRKLGLSLHAKPHDDAPAAELGASHDRVPAAADSRPPLETAREASQSVGLKPARLSMGYDSAGAEGKTEQAASGSARTSVGAVDVPGQRANATPGSGSRRWLLRAFLVIPYFLVAARGVSVDHVVDVRQHTRN